MKKISHNVLNNAIQIPGKEMEYQPITVGLFDNDFVIIEQPSDIADHKSAWIGISIENIDELIEALNMMKAIGLEEHQASNN